MKKRTLGIVREQYSKWERRAPLTPKQVAKAIQTQNLRVLVQPSTQRIFTDQEYLHAGAALSETLEECDCIVGVKQVDVAKLVANKTYLFFSHTIKAQEDNMKLLDTVLAKRIRLVDHECIKHLETGERLVAFGDYAGRAGMLESIRGLGLRLLGLGYSTPLLNVGPVFSYKSYDAALTAAKQACADYSSAGGSEVFLPRDFGPLCIVFTGAGKVSTGAQRVFRELPNAEMLGSVEDLEYGCINPTQIYGICVRDRDVIRSTNNGGFDKADYYANPHKYNADRFVDNVLPHANLIVTGAYWDARFPRWLPNTSKVQENSSHLLMVADVSCDIKGTFQGLNRSTTIDDPFYLVDFANGMREVARPCTMDTERNPNVKLVLGVDILPSELPREASEHFGNCLLPFLGELCQPEFGPTLSKAVIAENGKLTESFAYIGKIHSERLRHSKAELERAKSATMQLQGHLFDSRVMNRVLDLIENRGGAFQIAQASLAQPRVGFNKAHTTVLLRVSSPVDLEDLLVKIERLVKEAPEDAEAEVHRLSAEEEAQISGELESLALSGKEVGSGAAEESSKAAKLHTSAPQVIVFGSGLVSAPAIDYLINVCGKHVLAVSESHGELAKLKKRFPALSTSEVKLDPQNDDEFTRLISGSACVLSLLPPPLHPVIGRACLKENVPLVTASYAGGLTELNAEAKSQGVPMLCEMGLDPGMDHMSVMKLASDFGGGKEVVSFESYCGGLVAPECANNPLGYKLTWSPRGVLTALKNPAKFIRNGKVVDEPNILTSGGGPFVFNSLASLNMEYLPNRDSLQYANAYGMDLQQMDTFMRGTLRFRGFTEVLRSLQENGWLDDSFWERPAAAKSKLCWGDVCKQSDYTPRTWEYLHPNLHREIPPQAKTRLDALCSLFQCTLQMEAGDRDLILMEHRFKFRNGKQAKSTLMMYGNAQDSAMSITVGTTAAIGVRLILEGKHSGQGGGLHSPTATWVYGEALTRLAERGIKFQETEF